MRTGRRALLTGVGIIVAGVLPGFLTASLALRIRHDFAFGAATVGLTIALFYGVSMLASSSAGRVVERIGGSRGMRVTAAMTAGSCVGVAVLARSATSLVVLLVVGGVGNAMGGPAVSAILKQHVPAERHGLAFGAQQSGASLGALLAGLALPAVAIPLGWRWAYVGAAGLALVAAALAPAGEPGARDEPSSGPRHRLPTSVHALAVAAALASAAGVGFVSFLVLYAGHRGMGDATAGLLLAGVSLAATVSRIALGSYADRAGRDPLPAAAAMLAGSVAGYLLLIAHEPVVITVAALIAGSIGWAWPGALTLAVVQRSPAAPAHAVGVMMTGLFGGAVGGPLLVGLLADRNAFTVAWIGCASLALLAAATITATMRLERPATGSAPPPRRRRTR